MSQAKKINYREVLAKNVAKLRNAKNMKKEPLSLALSFDNSYISKLEKCNMNITLDKLEAIANYFDVTIIDLFS